MKGTHAFHNHTSSSLYTKANNDSRNGKRNVWMRQERERRASLAAEEQEPCFEATEGSEDVAREAVSPPAAPGSDGLGDDNSSSGEIAIDGALTEFSRFFELANAGVGRSRLRCAAPREISKSLSLFPDGRARRSPGAPSLGSINQLRLE
jgi:hypothetical protein